jgi:peptide/nickel transport system substrate-binding protein
MNRVQSMFALLTAMLVVVPATSFAFDYSEAPMLAAAVDKGELPPLEQRLPREPMVVKPVDEIGRYGGTWHRMMKGSSDFHAYGRLVYEQMVRWQVSETGGLEVGPGLVREWEFKDDDHTLRLHLRHGLRWSDGAPFSADDVLFWWRHIANDPNLSGSLPSYWKPDGTPMEVVKADSFTVDLRFSKPYPLALMYLAFKGNQWPLVFERAGFFAPRHYLEPYLPSGAVDVATYSIFEQKANDFNPDRPVMSAWRVTEWEPGNHLLAERNPYYWKVDPEGNQLPYLDQIRMEIFLNTEMINFRAVTGMLQMQQRHFTRENLPLLRSFTDERDYSILTYQSAGIRAIMPNLQYPGDPALEQLLMTREFRIALSLAIDRDLINRLCYDGTGRMTAMKLHPSAPDYVELTDAPDYAVYDPDRARALLDSIGLDQRDADGYRLGLDGKTVSLIMELATVVGPDMDAVEIVRSQWEAVGIKTALKPEERTLYFQRVAQNGEHMIGVQGAEATFPLLSSARWFSTSLWCEWGHHWARWYLSGGERGIEPPPEVQRLQKLQEILSVTVDANERKRLWLEVMRNHAENLWVIPLVAQSTSIGVVSNDFGNVPEQGVASWVAMTPGYLNPETFFSKSARALTTMDAGR